MAFLIAEGSPKTLPSITASQALPTSTAASSSFTLLLPRFDSFFRHRNFKMSLHDELRERQLTDYNQAFENTSTNVAAAQMRNALTNLAETVEDPKEKKVRNNNNE